MPLPWFDDGLRFQCTRCGNCCTGEPGNVWLTDPELAKLARRLELTENELRRRYTRRVLGVGRSLLEKPNGDCVFFDRDAGCTVYEDRPKQCRTWPFWRDVVRTETTWEIEAQDCPGMNQGRHFHRDEILKIIADDGLP